MLDTNITVDPTPTDWIILVLGYINGSYWGLSLVTAAPSINLSLVCLDHIADLWKA